MVINRKSGQYTAVILLSMGVLWFLLPFDRMTMSSLVILGFFAALISTGYYLTRDLASPQVILSVTWFISLFLTSLDVGFADRVSHFNQMLTTQTWFMIFGSILCFFLGATLMMYPLKTNYREVIGNQHLKWDEKRLDRIVLFSFGIAFTIFGYSILRSGGVPAFALNVNTSRSEFIPGTLGVFLTLFQLVIIITTLKLVQNGVKRSTLAIALSIMSILCIFLTTQRIGAIEAILMSVVLYVALWPYVPKEQREPRVKPLIVTSTILLGLFLWGFILIGQLRGLEEIQMTDLDNIVWEQLYIYFAGPAPRNFQMILEGGIYAETNEATNGALFFRPVLWLLGLRDEINLDDTFRGPNNATALFHYYVDLRLLGVLFFPLFWGGVSGFVYGCFRRKPSLRTCVLYAILANAIYFFPLSERFSEPSTFIKIVLFTVVITLAWFIRIGRRQIDFEK